MKAFAPVNIAWIKYMGKEEGRPTNASFSMTLDGVGTETEIRKLPSNGDATAALEFEFSSEGYQPPETGQAKAFRFLRNTGPFFELLQGLGLGPCVPEGRFLIETRNTVPAGTGIATSASGFAALTLAWIPHFLSEVDFLRFRELLGGKQASRNPERTLLRSALARIAGLGSGSACRSFDGPFVEWRTDGSVIPFESSTPDYVDFILILDSEVKAVSSSEAHSRVRSSPLFAGRPRRAEARLDFVKRHLSSGEFSALGPVILEEALDMHELFHTSQPAFRYFNHGSESLRDRFLDGAGLPSRNAALTFDAGANAHVFVPAVEAPLWESWFRREFPEVSFLRGASGRGARYR
jgi:diphosphomevalonate decarboxylase